MDLSSFPDTSVANPRASTFLEVLQIIRDEAASDAMPLTPTEIGRRMHAKKTRPEVIKTSIQLLQMFGAVSVGSKGVMYTKAPTPVQRRPTTPL